MIGRRAFITGLSAASVMGPMLARAQQQNGRLRFVGLLIGGDASDPQRRVSAFTTDMAKLGWTEGHNLRVEFRTGRGDAATMVAGARELVGMGVEIFVASGGTYRAIQQVTNSIPIVFSNLSEPVEQGA